MYHRFFESIGFDIYKDRRFFDDLIQRHLHNVKKRVINENKPTFPGLISVNEEIAKNIGISVIINTYENDTHIDIDSIYPYIIGDESSVSGITEIAQVSASVGFLGMSDDEKIDMPLIYRILDVGECSELLYRNNEINDELLSLNTKLSGLGKHGTIIFSLGKSNFTNNLGRKTSYINSYSDVNYNIEGLIHSLNVSNNVRNMDSNDDILGMIGSYIIPYGLESDVYQVLGDITFIEKYKNTYTGKLLYKLNIISNDIPMSICISEDLLEGEPMVGRRFKGIIWMQGSVDFRSLLGGDFYD